MLSRSLFRVRITAFTIRNVSRSISTSTSTTRSKVVGSISEALDTVKMKDGQTVLVGGFGLCGIPMACIQEIQKRGIKDLTVVSNNCGVDKWGLGILLQTKQIRRMISSYVGENAEFERQYFAGELEVELIPQGTLAEKMRAGGAGIPAFFTRTGAGTIIETGGLPIKYGKAEPGAKNRPVEIASAKKETANFDGSNYIMERSVRGDIGLVKAWKADTYGNLVFKGTARNFNPECAMAAKQVIAEVEEIVPIGSIDPHDVHLSGVYVTAVVQANAEKKIERLTVKKDQSASTDTSPEAALRERIVRRAALELKDGMDVNLGIGMPTLATNYLPPSVQVMYQSENGLLGMGPYPISGQHSPDLINAGKETVTMVPGASLFSSSQSFAMIRGNHIDISILGAMEVSEFGDLANWIIPGKMVKGMGGAMDLVASGSRIVICMEHTNKKKQPKILKKCSLPLTGVRCVNRIITELAVFDVDEKGLILIEHDKNTTIDQIRAVTEPQFRVSSNLKVMEYA